MATATEPTPPTTLSSPRPGSALAEPVVLQDISWDLYVRLCDADEHRKVKMTYLDGVLELMSPAYRHDSPCRRLGLFVSLVAMTLGIPCTGARSTTLRRPGEGEREGAGKEPDESFYFANEPAIRGNTELRLDVDPPPDLAIEVDNTGDTTRSFPTYARLGVPELWVYDVETEDLWFGKLQAGESYVPIRQSLSLPMVTPTLVLEALRLPEDRSETDWMRLVIDWVRATLGPPPGP